MRSLAKCCRTTTLICCTLLALLMSLVAICQFSDKKPENGKEPNVNVVWMTISYVKSIESRFRLLVSAPTDFKLIPTGTEAVIPPVIFIPKTDADIDSWTEMLVTQMYPASSLQARQVARQKRESYCSLWAPAQLLESENVDYGIYSVSTFLIVYSRNGRTELMHAGYFSGSHDCSGFQYIIALTDTMTLEKAREKIKEFLTHNIHIEVLKDGK